jgi:hypothetical protein
MWRGKFRATPEIFFNDDVRRVSQRQQREQQRPVDCKTTERKN